MRISDWSSDVCSSDLAWLLMKEVIARPSALFLDLRARLDRMMFGGYAPAMEVDAAELARLRSILREHPTAILFTHKTYIDGATPSRLAYENDLPMRSEEHTSELQSLMRISYAVFCLKKTNIHSITHIDNDKITYKIQ